MNKLALSIIVVAVVGLVVGIIFFVVRPNQTARLSNNTNQSNAKTMQITSPAFAAEQPIPSRFTCDGQNINPPLNIEQVPKEAKSLALIMDDPDAPADTFTHWLIWNLPIDTNIQENSLPPGAVTGLNDGGQTEYFGPCPPNGRHRYYFKLFALDLKLKLPAGAKHAQLEKAMSAHVVGEAQLMGTYSR